MILSLRSKPRVELYVKNLSRLDSVSSVPGCEVWLAYMRSVRKVDDHGSTARGQARTIDTIAEVMITRCAITINIEG